jgi:hypothetical protein
MRSKFKKDKSGLATPIVVIVLLLVLLAAGVGAYYLLSGAEDKGAKVPGSGPVIGYLRTQGAVVIDNGQVLGGTFLGFRDLAASVEPTPEPAQFVWPDFNSLKVTKDYAVKIIISSSVLGTYQWSHTEEFHQEVGGLQIKSVAFDTGHAMLGVRAPGTYHVTFQLWDHASPDVLVSSETVDVVVNTPILGSTIDMGV